jgi:hypothetical protein
VGEHRLLARDRAVVGEPLDGHRVAVALDLDDQVVGPMMEHDLGVGVPPAQPGDLSCLIEGELQHDLIIDHDDQVPEKIR